MPYPTSVNILGIVHEIAYKDNPADVDLHRRQALWGEVDHWTRTIRVYDNGRPSLAVWQTILHECLHVINGQLHLTCFDDNEDDLDRVATALIDMLERNSWLNMEGA